MAEGLGRFRPFISTVTKAAVLIYFSLMEPQGLFPELSGTGGELSREQPTAGLIGLRRSTIRECRALIFQERIVALPLAGQAESSSQRIQESPGSRKPAEPSSIFLTFILLAMVRPASQLARAGRFFGQQMAASPVGLPCRRTRINSAATPTPTSLGRRPPPPRSTSTAMARSSLPPTTTVTTPTRSASREKARHSSTRPARLGRRSVRTRQPSRSPIDDSYWQL